MPAAILDLARADRVLAAASTARRSLPALLCAAVAGGPRSRRSALACGRCGRHARATISARTHAAFALESATLEATYIAGPVLIAGAIGAWSTAAATLTCAALLLLGTAAFAAHAASRAWRSGARADGGRLGALRSPGVRTLMLVFFLLGATFGSVEVAVPVASEAAGTAGSAGLLLGVWGLGSLLGGLAAARAGAPADPVRRLTLAARRPRRRPPAARLRHQPAGPGRASCSSPAWPSPPPSPPPSPSSTAWPRPAAVTEAYTWLATGIAAGLAAGATLSGALAEAEGAGAAFAVAGAACAGAALMGGVRRTTLTPSRVATA